MSNICHFHDLLGTQLSNAPAVHVQYRSIILRFVRFCQVAQLLRRTGLVVYCTVLYCTPHVEGPEQGALEAEF